ncbi:MAG: hypothetical protein V3S43_06430 [Acidimicrobiia bacterium]
MTDLRRYYHDPVCENCGAQFIRDPQTDVLMDLDPKLCRRCQNVRNKENAMTEGLNEDAARQASAMAGSVGVCLVCKKGVMRKGPAYYTKAALYAHETCSPGGIKEGTVEDTATLHLRTAQLEHLRRKVKEKANYWLQNQSIYEGLGPVTQTIRLVVDDFLGLVGDKVEPDIPAKAVEENKRYVEAMTGTATRDEDHWLARMDCIQPAMLRARRVGTGEHHELFYEAIKCLKEGISELRQEQEERELRTHAQTADAMAQVTDWRKTFDKAHKRLCENYHGGNGNNEIAACLNSLYIAIRGPA